MKNKYKKLLNIFRSERGDSIIVVMGAIAAVGILAASYSRYADVKFKGLKKLRAHTEAKYSAGYLADGVFCPETDNNVTTCGSSNNKTKLIAYGTNRTPLVSSTSGLMKVSTTTVIMRCISSDKEDGYFFTLIHDDDELSTGVTICDD